jgi:hypothetical protein
MHIYIYIVLNGDELCPHVFSSGEKGRSIYRIQVKVINVNDAT